MGRNGKTPTPAPSSDTTQERSLSQRLAEVDCAIIRAKTVALVLQKLTEIHEQEFGSDQPLPLLELTISDLRSICETIGFELDTALEHAGSLEPDLLKADLRAGG